MANRSRIVSSASAGVQSVMKAFSTSFGSLKWADKNGVGLARALAVVTCEPARVLGGALGPLQSGAGRLLVGGAADLCVFDPQAEWMVAAGSLRSRGKHTPFSGYALPCSVCCTIVGGQVAFEA